ncbi:MAG: PIG-L deacetylase family protein [Terriglobia bacterium]|jgi:LmbE family N-acetylglucosaminyl deacetylase
MTLGNKKILAVGAHPDDVEIMCAGTLFLLGNIGYELHVATMSLGDCGSMEHAAQEIRRIRRTEAEDACRALGAMYHYLGFSDFAIFNTDEANRRTTALLREIDPAVVFTHPPQDYLTDHEMTSLLVRNACFYAPAPNYDTLSFTCAVRSSGIPFFFYAHSMEGTDLFGKPITPQFYVDISSSIEKKLEMLGQHKTQRGWLRAHHGIDEYIESVRRWNAQLAKRAASASSRSLQYAEGFRQHRGHSYPRENVLTTLLEGEVIPEPSY